VSKTSAENKVRAGKKRVGFALNLAEAGFPEKHNRFGWQVKTATTNGVFEPKKPQFRIVDFGKFSYIFDIRCRTKFYPDLHHNYVEYF
jgi:hypothetical protein